MPQLTREFFNRSPLVVAPELLGRILVRHVDGHTLFGRITEVEAYTGFADEAAHSYRGQTPRNSVLFGPAGHAYVHSIHRYHCIDVVTEGAAVPTSILIRALHPLSDIEQMQEFRNAKTVQTLTNGPGKLCQALRIDLTCNGVDMTQKNAPLQLHTDEFKPKAITRTTRIGISKATDLEYRFLLSEPKLQ